MPASFDMSQVKAEKTVMATFTSAPDEEIQVSPPASVWILRAGFCVLGGTVGYRSG
jgi:hypothetical protein